MGSVSVNRGERLLNNINIVNTTENGLKGKGEGRRGRGGWRFCGRAHLIK